MCTDLKMTFGTNKVGHTDDWVNCIMTHGEPLPLLLSVRSFFKWKILAI